MTSKHICRDCPFRKDSQPTWCGQPTEKENRLELLNFFEMYRQEKRIDCHKFRIDGKERGCRGQIAMYKKSCKLPILKDIVSEVLTITDEEKEVVLIDFLFKKHHKLK